MATWLSNFIVRNIGKVTREMIGFMNKPSMLIDHLKVTFERDPTTSMAVLMGGTTITAIPTIKAITHTRILPSVIKEIHHFEVAIQTTLTMAKIDATTLHPILIPLTTLDTWMHRLHNSSYNGVLFVIHKLPTMLLPIFPSIVLGHLCHLQNYLRSWILPMLVHHTMIGM